MQDIVDFSGLNHLKVLVMKSNFSGERDELLAGLRKCVDCKWSHKNPDCPFVMDVSAYWWHIDELHCMEGGGMTMN